MKKIYVIVAILLILSVGGVGWMGVNIYAQRDQVTIRENKVVGDSSVAEGLTITLRNKMAGHAFWETTYQVGDEEDTETKYSFSLVEKEEKREYKYLGIELYNALTQEFEFATRHDNQKLSEPQELYLKTLNEMEAGEEKTLTLYLKDYSDYYSVRMLIDIPGTVWADNDPETEVGENPYDPWYVLNRFQEFFKIPVLESDCVEMTLKKAGNPSNGASAYTSGGISKRDVYSFETVSAYTENTCYFTISNRKEREVTLNQDVTYMDKEYIDTSQIPGGYGIYAFSYGRTEGEYHTGIDADSLKMVFPLEKKALVKYMMIRDDQSQMVLITEENNDAYVTVIDLETMQQVQKFLLEENLYDSHYYTEVIEEDDFIVLLTRGVVIVIAEEKGVYGHAFTVEDGQTLDYVWNYHGRSMDFDGEKLALVGDSYGRTSYVSTTCDFYLAVYDKTGLIYYGVYENSLSGTRSGHYDEDCMPMDINPYAVMW